MVKSRGAAFMKGNGGSRGRGVGLLDMGDAFIGLIEGMVDRFSSPSRSVPG